MNKNKSTGNTDCFAYTVNKCNALTEMVCKKRKCTFYKTMEQYKADKEKYKDYLYYR